jgi:hypothetical protein
MAAKGTKNRKIEATEAATVLDSVKDIDLGKAVAEVGSLQVIVQSALADLSANLTGKIQKLDQIDQATRLKEQRLKELHGIEDLAVTIDDMKAQKEEEGRFWAQQRVEREARWDEEAQDKEKELKREQEQYQYDTALTRKKMKDEFDAEVNERKRAEAVRQDMLTKNWTERENGLKAHEQEVADLRKQVSEFDARLKSEIAREVAVVGNTMKRQHEHETQLLKKDGDSNTKLAEMRVGSLEKCIAGLHEQIHDLSGQLDKARDDARHVATQALQASSGRQVADALQQVVNQRADPPTKGK